MSETGPEKKTRPSAVDRAEAAAWIARLHGPNRTPEVEAGLRRWMADAPERAAAFELLTDIWEKSARLRRRPFEKAASWELPGFRISLSRAALAAAAVAGLAVISTLFLLRTDAVVTGVGERRTLTLQDGTRVHLNTSTRAVVHYDERARRVELERGEALFEVAKRPDWPFIVIAGDRQIRALGTAFMVRRDDRGLEVTLVEGRVTVSPVPVPSPTDARVAIESQAPPAVAEAISKVVTLSPGQRLTFARRQAPVFDRPALDRITAWQRGQVALDSTPLADAVAEMNRYSTTQLVIGDPRTAAIQISGVFRAGDTENFARAVAKTYGLRVVKQRHRIILAVSPSG